MTTIARRCQRCLGSWIQAVSFSSRPLSTSTKSPIAFHAAAIFPSSTPITVGLQVRGAAFLRPGPARGLSFKTGSKGNGKNPSPLLSISFSSPTIQDADSNTYQEQTLSASDTEVSTLADSQTSPASTRPPCTHQQYKEIVLLETDFRERFIKGGGNGGQKINKTNSNVELKHFETGIVVQCQATRSLPQNRKLARRILINRLDEYYNGEMSKRGQKAEKIREKKRRMARKASKKYHHDQADSQSKEEDDDDMEGEIDQRLLGDDRDGGVARTPEPPAPLEEIIQLTTLEAILARNNKKPSRRKAKK
ncbi:hypothetical protein MVEG_09151 [Podila verticillata NRRL 6337]|nr:hypothetical protein MVEG_09151 [Podila verticillata NRRL 6337]